jgi:AcrR family transcriptional regulator
MNARAADTEPPAARPKRTRRRTGSYAAADGRRRAILDAAIEHFAQSGYLKASIARIATDAGTSPAGLLHHFGSKERLLMAVLEARDEHGVALEAIPPADIPDDSFEVTAEIRRMLSLVEHNMTQPGLMQLFTKLSAEATDPEHPAHDFFVQRYAQARRTVQDLLERGTRLGQLAPRQDWDRIAAEIFAVWDGLQLQWALAPDSVDLPAALHAYADRLLTLLAAPL